MASSTRADDAPPLTSKHEATVEDAKDDLNLLGDSASTRSMTINRPRAELFAYFRDLANLPTFMDSVVRVDVHDALHAHWVVRSTAGKTIEWDSTISEEEAPSFFAWTALGDVSNSGRIEFHDAGPRGTVVTAMIAYDPPAGAIGKLVAKLFQREPAVQMRRDLRRLKQLMETGEIATAARTSAQRADEEEK